MDNIRNSLNVFFGEIHVTDQDGTVRKVMEKFLTRLSKDELKPKVEEKYLKEQNALRVWVYLYSELEYYRNMINNCDSSFPEVIDIGCKLEYHVEVFSPDIDYKECFRVLSDLDRTEIESYFKTCYKERIESIGGKIITCTARLRDDYIKLLVSEYDGLPVVDLNIEGVSKNGKRY